MATPLAERVAVWLLGRPNGATSAELQKEFGITKRQVCNLRDYYQKSGRYTSHWTGVNGAQPHGALPPRLYVTEMFPRKKTPPRTWHYATPIPGNKAEPLLFFGVQSLVQEGYLPMSIRRAMDRLVSHAGYVWTSAPIDGWKYRQVPLKERKDV